MKAWIDRLGVLHIAATTATDEFALGHWIREAEIDIKLVERAEHHVYRGSRLKLLTLEEAGNTSD